MCYFPTLLLSTLSLSILFISNVPIVLGGLIPPRKLNILSRQNADVAAVEMTGLSFLSRYVCNPQSNTAAKRQASGTTTVTFTKSDLQELLLELRLLELHIVDVIQTMGDGDGSDPAASSETGSSTDVALPSVTGDFASMVSQVLGDGSGGEFQEQDSPMATSMPLDTLSSAVDSALSGLTTPTTLAASESDEVCSYNTSTTVITLTMTTTDTGLTVTATATSSAGMVAPFVVAPTPYVVAPSTTGAFAANNTMVQTNAAASSTTMSEPGAASTNDAAGQPASSTGQPSPGTTLTSSAGSGSTMHEVVGSAGTSGYVFDSQSTKNVAVYFGQTPVTGTTTLAAQCADPNIDIVILAFLISQLDGGLYPGINFGAACGGQTPTMESEAPGLLSCPDLAGYISTCQSTYGKKVLLSIGGATSQIAFSTASQASNFGDVLWQLFGPTGNIDIELRPFGDVVIDGFDVDNEDNLPSNFDILASTLRSHYSSDTSKTYYLSSAPQCPFPDASNPPGLLALCDFVWVQFYNNPNCEIGSALFVDSINQWSTALKNSTLPTKPRLYVGAPAFSAAGSTAYAKIGSAEGMQSVASEVEQLGLSNFGGIMFWDGPEGMLNVEGGKDIIAWAKEGLTQ